MGCLRGSRRRSIVGSSMTKHGDFRPSIFCSYSFLTHSTDGPDSSDEMNRPIRSDGKRCPNMFSQGNSSFFRKRHSIARSWPLPTQKRGPVIVEIAEDGGNVN